MLSQGDSTGAPKDKDIINSYFDRGSSIYAPIKRAGKNLKEQGNKYDVVSRTMPLDNVGNILTLEQSMKPSLMNTAAPQLSKTMGAIDSSNGPKGRGGRASEPRMTSATLRAIRMTKKEVEDMHLILQQKKYEGASTTPGGNSPNKGGRAPAGGAQNQGAGDGILAKKVSAYAKTFVGYCL